MKLIKITGLVALLSYTSVFLIVWMYSNYQGSIYFLAGEPISIIKYLEWVLGVLGIFVALGYMRKEIFETGDARGGAADQT